MARKSIGNELGRKRNDPTATDLSREVQSLRSELTAMKATLTVCNNLLFSYIEATDALLYVAHDATKIRAMKRVCLDHIGFARGRFDLHEG